MKYNNQELAHKFFYAGGSNSGNSCHYEGDRYFSYSTCIGLIYTNKKGQKTLFISWHNFSNITAKHLNHLRRACPFEVKEAFFKYGNYVMDINGLAENANGYIKDEMERKVIYTRKPDREFAEKILEVAENLHNITGVKIPLLKKYKKYLEKKLNTENIKAEKAKEREKAKKAKAVLEKKVAKFRKEIANIPLLDVIKDLYFTTHPEEQYADYAYKRGLFKQMFDVKDPSFVIINGDDVNTTQRITMPLEQVLPLLKAWKHKHNILGQKLGWYTVLANNSKMVKIGCHNIPIENIQALADTLLK